MEEPTIPGLETSRAIRLVHEEAAELGVAMRPGAKLLTTDVHTNVALGKNLATMDMGISRNGRRPAALGGGPTVKSSSRGASPNRVGPSVSGTSHVGSLHDGDTVTGRSTSVVGEGRGGERSVLDPSDGQGGEGEGGVPISSADGAG